MAAKTTRSTGTADPAHRRRPSHRPTDRPLTALFDGDTHVQVEATWGIYQRMIAAYREPDRAIGRELMVKLIESVSDGVPKMLTELVTLGRTLKQRAADVLAYFERPGTSGSSYLRWGLERHAGEVDAVS